MTMIKPKITNDTEKVTEKDNNENNKDKWQ